MTHVFPYNRAAPGPFQTAIAAAVAAAAAANPDWEVAIGRPQNGGVAVVAKDDAAFMYVWLKVRYARPPGT